MKEVSKFIKWHTLICLYHKVNIFEKIQNVNVYISMYSENRITQWWWKELKGWKLFKDIVLRNPLRYYNKNSSKNVKHSLYTSFFDCFPCNQSVFGWQMTTFENKDIHTVKNILYAVFPFIERYYHIPIFIACKYWLQQHY